ncbi:FtsB family cell division protein [Streptococcus ovuberis]|uniref:Septum formation initiator family protein n=1 Tax=Streptococcus ovuberis TaxID=1936207 RepID=A0A7X6N0P0_9STRE|nr:septum formation initiator family protein [Streptococcus ovuberis]NKZ21366.1 septum formation initiator family protein [Streptococcus ovuberis]
MKKSKVLQLNNSFIQEERSKRQSVHLEKQRKNRFMGMILILIIFLFTLPAYNLLQSYEQLLGRREKLAEMKTSYQALEKRVEEEQSLVKKLSDKDYVAKYVRAKYHYSKDGEFVYTIPSLLPTSK